MLRSFNSPTRWLLTSVFVTLAALIFSTLVWAHASFLGSEPGAGESLSLSPTRIVVKFNELVSPVSMQLIDASGTKLSILEPVELDGTDLIIPISDTLEEGGYLFSYRVASGDGHPIAGSIGFSVGVGEIAQIMAASSSQNSVSPLATRLFRAGFLLLSLVAAGLALFPLVFENKATRTAVRYSSAAIAFGLIYLLLDGLTLTGSGFTQLLDAGTIGTSVKLGAGGSILIAILGLLTLIFSTRLQGRHRNGLAVLAAVIIAGSRGLTGHPQSQSPGWLLQPAMMLHILLIMFWVGSLPLLLRAVKDRSPTESAIILERFSSLAVTIVSILIGAGVAMSLVHLTGIGDIKKTEWGNLLGFKLIAVGVLLLLAVLNKLRFTPRLEAGDTKAQKSVILSIRLELILMAVVFLLSAFLASTPPPKATLQPNEIGDANSTAIVPSERSDPSRSTQAMGMQDDLHVMLTLTPGNSISENSARITVKDTNGEPLDVSDIGLTLARPDLGVAPVYLSLSKSEPGVFKGQTGDLVIAGKWAAKLEIFISDFDKTELVLEIDVASN